MPEGPGGQNNLFLLVQVPSALESFTHTCLLIVNTKNITSKSRSKIAQTSLRQLPCMTKCCVHPVPNKACTQSGHNQFLILGHYTPYKARVLHVVPVGCVCGEMTTSHISLISYDVLAFTII